MLHRKIIFSFLLILVSSSIFSVPYTISEKINWDSIQSVKIDENFTIERLSFKGANYPDFGPLPRYTNLYPVHTASADISAALINIRTMAVSAQEASLLSALEGIDTSFSISAQMVVSRKEPFAKIEVIPIRWNEQTKTYEKLLAFDIVLEVADRKELMSSNHGYATSSVLASGDWFKVKIDKSGIFKLTYQELNSMGFDVGRNPKSFAVFGNGGGTLPEKNNDFRYDDLMENPIVVVGEEDGKFDPSDYILFYGQGPVIWKYNNSDGSFRHQTNYYDDYAYYFVTALDSDGKRIQKLDEPAGSPATEINSFTDYTFHEIDEVNIAGTGRVWYGESFDFNTTAEFNFNFPNTLQNEFGKFYADFATTAESPSQFLIYLNNVLEETLAMPIVSSTSAYQIGKDRSTRFDYKPTGDQLSVKLVYQRSNNSSASYLNYIDLNVKRQLKMAGNQMRFRQPTNNDQVVKYNVSSANGITIWDITTAVSPGLVVDNASSDNFSFKAFNDTLREYIAFNGNEFYQTLFVGKIENQNLHQVRNIDYLMVVYPDFIDQANRLAKFHTEKGLSVYITTPDKIYNEFSSGAQDVTAIRDFAKMLYDDSDPGKELRYLLLFGDASYDYKYLNKDTENNNFVPCWESLESLNIVWSIASDDYFGYLDDGEGGSSGSDKVDIGIGRFVASSLEEAEMSVDKSLHYGNNTPKVMAPWRNRITFVADDEDNNTHLVHAETLSRYVKENYPVYNIDKIYVDAYKQVSTPAGQRVPDVNASINQTVEKGTLIMNYNGHGGEIGWGHERFLEVADINSWNNYDHMPIFITATCEFSRYDDPTRVSAGELVFLNPDGGGIALFSTSRATFASSNLSLNMAIYENNIFTKKEGTYPRFGDVIRQSKVLTGDNDKKFILLGDPGLMLAYTEHIAETVMINHNLTVENEPDTLQALAKVKVEGIILDRDGEHLTDYSGTIFPTIYDKYSEIVTLGDNNTNPYKFLLRQSILFNGKASIVEGNFKFEFIVPRDIAYKYGGGRISYYFRNDTIDGAGYTEGIIIGGYDEQADQDNTGPDVQLFMNDTTFVTGDITDQNPILLAKVWDESGINTTGNGIGHDISAILDNDQGQTYILNQYYEANRDSYNSGQIDFPFKDLENGMHTLSLKVWDIYNNSTTARLEFLVSPAEQLVIQNLMNYPNPFVYNTNFVFDHNQSGRELQVKIEIFSSNGERVKTIETTMTPEGYKSTPIPWDGTADNGALIGRGFHVFKTTVQNEDGYMGQETGKLIFLK